MFSVQKSELVTTPSLRGAIEHYSHEPSKKKASRHGPVLDFDGMITLRENTRVSRY